MSTTLDNLISSLKLDQVITDQWIDVLITEFAYNGIDIDAIMKKISALISGSDVNKSYLTMLIGIGLTRGNKISKIRKSLPSASIKKFEDAVAAFEIKESLSLAGSDKPRALTLARLRVVVPQVAAQILHYERVPRPVSMMELTTIAGIFNPIFRDNCVASLIITKPYNGFDESAINGFLLNIFLYSYLESDKLTSKANKSPNNMDRADKTLNFLLTSWRSSHVSERMRERFCSSYLKNQSSYLESTVPNIMGFLSKEGVSVPRFLTEYEDES